MNDEFKLIMNFSNYYSAGEIEYGIDGPEINGDKLYISIYHYLEFIGENPRNYDTLKLGEYLTSKSFDYKVCKYKSQHFDINKFNLELLKEERSNFSNYRKVQTIVNRPTTSYRQPSYSGNYKPCPQCGAMHNASFNRCAVCNDFSAANDNDWY
jgi:hypothetical protein